MGTVLSTLGSSGGVRGKFKPDRSVLPTAQLAAKVASRRLGINHRLDMNEADADAPTVSRSPNTYRWVAPFA